MLTSGRWLAIFALLLNVSDLTAQTAPFVPSRNAQCVAYSPDGKLIATGTSGMSNDEFPPRPHPAPRKCGVVQIFEVETGTKLRRMETFGDLTKVSFSPDGKTVAYSRLYSTADGVAMNEVRLWDVATGKSVHQFDRCHGFDFSPDGKSIAVLSRTRCILFDVKTLKKQHEIVPLKQAVSVQFSPDGKTVAGIVPINGKCFIELCNSATGQLLGKSITLDAPFYNLVFTPDGTTLATGHVDGTVVLWGVAGVKPLARLTTGNRSIQHPFFSPDGAVLGAGNQANGDVVFWQVSTRKELRRYTFQRGEVRTFLRRDAKDPLRPESDPARFTFSPDGNNFLAGCFGAMIRSISDGREIRRFSD